MQFGFSYVFASFLFIVLVQVWSVMAAGKCSREKWVSVGLTRRHRKQEQLNFTRTGILKSTSSPCLEFAGFLMFRVAGCKPSSLT